MQWLNEPSSWQRTGDVITVTADPGTDFWRETGYGYIRDSGHIYGELLGGDLDVSVRVRATFANQYDQAGIMLRVDARLWLKTGMEFFEGRPRLSTVLTLGRSSWMVTDLPEGTDEIGLRAARRGDAVEIRYRVADGPAELAALLFLPAGREVLAGIMCAAPEGPGFGVTFHELRIDDREWLEAGEGHDGGWAAEPGREDAPEDEPGWAYQPTGHAGFQWLDEPPDDGEPEWAAGPAGDAGADEPTFAVGAGADAGATAAGPGTPGAAGLEAGPREAGDLDGSELHGGHLDDGELHGGYVDGSELDGGYVDGSELDGGYVDGGELHGGELDGQALDGEGPDAGQPGGELEGSGAHDGGAGPERRAASHGDARSDWSGPMRDGAGGSDAAADWDRLAAFARARSWAPEPASDVGDSWPGPPLARAAQQRRAATDQRGEPAAGPSERPGDAHGAGGEEGEPPRAGSEPSQDARAAANPRMPSASGTGSHREELPESIADDPTEPELPAAGPPPHRKGLRKKAPPGLPAPLDPADEWISLLTADD